MEFERSIEAIVAQRPQRAGGFIVTLYGDVVEPRGGMLWIGNLIETCAGIGISESLVRTAVSRLVTAGRLEGERAGRLSYYRLTPAGQAEFAAAAEVLFAPPRERGICNWRIMWLPDAALPEAAQRLERSGYGRLAPRLAIAVSDDSGDGDNAAEFGEALEFAARLSPDTPPERLRALAAHCWPLQQYAEDYAAFLRLFRPLETALARRSSLPDGAACLTARLLLVNEFRRIALADPRLPSDALPADWPGRPARALYARLYGRLSGPADAHVARSFRDANGLLQVRGDAIARRLAALSRY